MHTTNRLRDGYLGSGVRLRRSIRRFGAAAHRFRIIKQCSSFGEMSRTERDEIAKHLGNPNCLNLNEGGCGSWGYVNRVHHNNRGNRRHTGGYGWKFRPNQKSNNFRRKMSNGLKRRIALCGHWWTGRCHSVKARRKMSRTAKKRIAKYGHVSTGRHHSDLTKRRISRALRRRAQIGG
jgi:hypothetical protein